MHVKLSCEACIREAETRCCADLDPHAQQSQVELLDEGHHEVAHLHQSARHDRCEQNTRAAAAEASNDADDPKHSGERNVADEELHIEEHDEELDEWEVSFPVATWLPGRGSQSRSQIAAIDVARLRVAKRQKQPPSCPSGRRATQGRAWQKATNTLEQKRLLEKKWLEPNGYGLTSV